MKILFLSPWYPYPPNNGSKIRIYHLLRALARAHEVSLLSFVRDGESVDPQGLKTVCSSVRTAPRQAFKPWRAQALLGFLSPLPRSAVDTYSQEMENLVKTSLREQSPDVVIASELGTAPYAHNNPDIPCILEDVELGVIHDAWERSAAPFLRWRRGLTWLKTRRYAGRLARRFDACTVVSERERALLSQAAPGYQDVHVVPNGVDLESLQTGTADPQPNTMIYNGALTYGANYDAMRYFLADILPLIRAGAPEATLRITGSTKDVDVEGLAIDAGVTLTGFLPDIRPVVAGAWACVVPLRVGGGTRLKILEAMALGTPVIATSKGAEGLDVTPEEDILIADEPQAFAAQTVRLLQDPDLRVRLARSGRRLMEARYGWSAIGQGFLRVVENVAREGK
jgi:glycosyltransferase involved in cell wall biosynthesis